MSVALGLILVLAGVAAADSDGVAIVSGTEAALAAGAAMELAVRDVAQASDDEDMVRSRAGVSFFKGVGLASDVKEADVAQDAGRGSGVSSADWTSWATPLARAVSLPAPAAAAISSVPLPPLA